MGTENRRKGKIAFTDYCAKGQEQQSTTEVGGPCLRLGRKHYWEWQELRLKKQTGTSP